MQLVLSHVALLVSSVVQSAAYLSSQGFKCGEAEVFESEGTKEIYVGDYQEQNALLLLLEPIGAGPYQKAMNKRGPSLHHLAFDVLNMNEFVSKAKEMNWQLHPISNNKTSWLFQKNCPLIEVHENKSLSNKPSKISEIQMPTQLKDSSFFDHILGSKLTYGEDLSLVMDGVRLSFSKIACVK